MTRKKVSLANLKVKSFVTATRPLKGGVACTVLCPPTGVDGCLETHPPHCLVLSCNICTGEPCSRIIDVCPPFPLT